MDLKNKRKWAIAAAVVLLIVGQITLAIRRAPGVRESAAGQATAEVKRGTVRETVFGAGRVQPADRTELTAPQSASVAAVHVAAGQRVAAGQLLVELSSPEVAAQERQARLDVQRLEGDLAELERKQADLEVVAPFDGVVDSVTGRQGDRVESGDVLVKVRRDKLTVTVPFDAAQVQGIEPGQKARVFLYDTLETVEGVVTDVNKGGRPAQAGVVAYDVTVALTNPGALVAGIRADVTVETPSGQRTPFTGGELVQEVKEMKARAAGQLGSVFARPGDRVVKGQSLLRVQSPELAQQIESVRLQLAGARLQLDQREAALKQLSLTARAPGIVLDVKVKGGDQVQPGAVLAVVADTDRAQIVAPLSERDVVKVRPGMAAEVRADAFPDKVFVGEVAAVATEGKSKGGSADFDVTVTIPQPDGLRPGMTATVDIVVGERRNVLTVPVEALREREGKTYVLVPGVQGGPPVERPVRVGLMNEMVAEIVSGLREGEKVLMIQPAGVGDVGL